MYIVLASIIDDSTDLLCVFLQALVQQIPATRLFKMISNTTNQALQVPYLLQL